MTALALLIALLGPAGLLPGSSDQRNDTVRFYVSPDGNDAWSGRHASPDDAGTDGPLATLHACQTKIRESRRASAEAAARPVLVVVREGTYTLSASLHLSAEDGGTSSAPVIWRAHPGEHVVISGGRELSGFAPLQDAEILQRLPERSRSHVIYLDLTASGVTDFGAIEQRGSPGMELFQDGVRMTPACWPNEGWARIADVPQRGDSLLHPGLEREKRFDGVPAGRHYGTITYDGDRPGCWGDLDQVFLHGYWTFDWSDSYQGITSIDSARKEIHLSAPHHHYGYTKNQRFRAVNVLEELDRPGEWFVNRRTGILLFWAPDSLRDRPIEISMLEDPLVTLEGTHNISVEGFHFTVSRGSGIVILGGEANQIAGCTFTNLGGDAVVVDGGLGHRIQSCDIFDVARGGIRLAGGDRAALLPGRHAAVNNHIHHWSRWLRTGNYAIMLDGVGLLLAHNLIHDAPFEAVYLKGNEHLIEYNEIHRVTQETGDAGALHTGRDWTWRGNVIRHNYFHDLQGPGLQGVMGVYLDDWASDFLVYGNLFYRAGRATLIGGGRHNVVDNNVYIECRPSVHVDARGLSWAGYYFDGSRPELFTKLKEMHYDRPPYSERYPELRTYLEGNPAMPRDNHIVRNISWGGRWLDVYDANAFDLSVVEVRDNVLADSVLLRRRMPGLSGWDPYYLNIDLQEGYEHLTARDEAARTALAGNVLGQHPLAFDPDSRRLVVLDAGLLDSIGFQPLQTEQMGIQLDDYRTVLPPSSP